MGYLLVKCSQPVYVDTRNGRNVSTIRQFVEMWIVLYINPNLYRYKAIYSFPIKSGEGSFLLHWIVHKVISYINMRISMFSTTRINSIADAKWSCY